ncbi:YcaO-like family protein [Devriesea agamarum]|uniref:YcaO-like family protein n=1 Tax=Devriesea agamarum TaxID=472569 RepID=UPI00155EF9BD|nr:YcaO-like family protein [Devriesea agamarum]
MDSESSSVLGLRRCSIDELEVPLDVLVNPVAGYLGSCLNCEVGWQTAAPATGNTFNWNGKEVRQLSWSGHSGRFGCSQKMALLEGIERRVGALQSSGEARIASANELEGKVITPEDFPMYPASFYGRRGAAFDPNEKHEWVRVTSIVSGELAWIPREYIYYGEKTRYRLWAFATSSGCATGSSIDEARLFGLLELIERDAFVASWYGKIQPQILDISDVHELKDICHRARLLGIKFEVGLIKSALQIPVVIATATKQLSMGPVSAVGTACHPTLLGAINGAIKEAWTFVAERVRAAQRKIERIQELAINPTVVNDIEDHMLLLAGASQEEYKNLCGTGDPIRPKDLERSVWEIYADHPPEKMLRAVTSALLREGIDVWSHTQTSEIERNMRLETVMVVAPRLLPVDFGWDLQRALQAPRLRELMEVHHGHVIQPRLLPHPFS